MSRLPKKKEGELLGAGHINLLSKASEQILKKGSGGYGFQGAGGQFSGLPPHAQRVGIITNVDNSPIVEFKLRYFDSEDTTETANGSWVTDDNSGPYYLDENAIDSSFSVDDKVVVWWDAQRNMWAPAGSGGAGSGEIRFLITDTSPGLGESATGCDWVEATVTAVTCSGAGVSVGDTVYILDPEYCHFVMPDIGLIGLNGVAHYIQNPFEYNDFEDCAPPYDAFADGCVWAVVSLCCAEEQVYDAS